MRKEEKEEYVKFNPDLQPKSHTLKVSYWVGEKQDPDWDFDKEIQKYFKGLGYGFCGSGFDFEERRRDIEFYIKKSAREEG